MNQDALTQEVESFRCEVEDALDLLEFAVSHGRPMDDQVGATLRRGQDLMASSLLPSVDERVAFDRAYRALAQSMYPVTAETLRSTSDAFARGEKRGVPRQIKSIFAPWGPVSEAKIWSRKLWLITFLVLLGMILVVENIDEAGTNLPARLAPFVYGALGALAYLLRVCHEFIHQRDFDRQRVPEYYSRVLLGAVSGGSILLYTQEAELTIGNNAIAFLAGYNTELLFSSLERIAAAILPRIVESASAVRQRQAATTAASTATSPEAGAAEPAAATHSAHDERVARIQAFLAEIDIPAYAPGGTDGIWDERTRLAAVAFLAANFRSLKQYEAAVAAPAFESFDREKLVAEMSPFVLPKAASHAA